MRVRALPEQEVWSGGKRHSGAFLHSPLLEELKSLQAMLEEGLPQPLSALKSQRTVSVELSNHSGDSERVELPMLPSLAKNATVSQHFEQKQAGRPQSGGGTLKAGLPANRVWQGLVLL
jgi:hypothetical protein